MKRQTPKGYPVTVRYDNRDAFAVSGGFVVIRPETFQSIKQIAGPAGVLWNTQRGSDGITFYFIREMHAVEVMLRWG
jgi:hypothetical protein